MFAVNRPHITLVVVIFELPCHGSHVAAHFIKTHKPPPCEVEVLARQTVNFGSEALNLPRKLLLLL